MAAITNPINYLSYAASLECHGAMLRLKKDIAYVSWCSTTSNTVDDASHLTMNGLSKSGSCKTSVVDNFCFSYWNAKMLNQSI